jgi:hypothetical protein
LVHGEKGLTNAPSELATIARLALPMAVAQFGLMALSLVDVAVLGHVSAAELGGGSIGRSIGFAGAGLGIGAAAALEPLAAQAVGAGEPHVAWRSFVATAIACVGRPQNASSIATTPCGRAMIQQASSAAGVTPSCTGTDCRFITWSPSTDLKSFKIMIPKAPPLYRSASQMIRSSGMPTLIAAAPVNQGTPS